MLSSRRQRYRVLSQGQVRHLRCRIDEVRGELPYSHWCRAHKIYDVRRMTLPMQKRLEAAGVSTDDLQDDWDGTPRPAKMSDSSRLSRNPELCVMGQTLRRLRRQLDWTQFELAQKLCVDNSTVSNWEAGWCFLPAERMPELAKILRVPLTKLYEGLL